MSILLMGLPDDVAEATIERLRAQGDEVRVIEPDAQAQQTWRSAGAYVATGDLDADLVERAAQGVRTLVMGRWLRREEPMEELLAGAVRAGVGRVVVYTDRDDAEGWGQAFPESVVLRAPRKRTLFGRRERVPSKTEAAQLIDAADDLAGPLRLDLDVTKESWAPLGLTAPWEA